MLVWANVISWLLVLSSHAWDDRGMCGEVHMSRDRKSDMWGGPHLLDRLGGMWGCPHATGPAYPMTHGPPFPGCQEVGHSTAFLCLGILAVITKPDGFPPVPFVAPFAVSVWNPKSGWCTVDCPKHVSYLVCFCRVPQCAHGASAMFQQLSRGTFSRDRFGSEILLCNAVCHASAFLTTHAHFYWAHSQFWDQVFAFRDSSNILDLRHWIAGRNSFEKKSSYPESGSSNATHQLELRLHFYSNWYSSQSWFLSRSPSFGLPQRRTSPYFKVLMKREGNSGVRPTPLGSPFLRELPVEGVGRVMYRVRVRRCQEILKCNWMESYEIKRKWKKSNGIRRNWTKSNGFKRDQTEILRVQQK